MSNARKTMLPTRTTLSFPRCAAVITPISNGFEFFDTEDTLCTRGDVSELSPVRASVRHLVRHNQVMLGVDGDLHVVTDDAGTAAARCHRATVGIGQGDLLIGRGKHLLLVLVSAAGSAVNSFRRAA